jgi:hypothetical protein
MIDLIGNKSSFRLHCDAGTKIEAAPITLWHAYGRGREGMRVTLTSDVSLPWQGKIELEVLG